MSRPVILCVDDERIILSSLKAQLQNNLPSNFQIEVTESAEEALEIVQELIKDDIELPLVIADQIMPSMKGNELLGKIKELLPQTLTIMLTGQADADAVGNAVNKAGLFRYLSKPWDEDDLILTIQSALDSYEHQKNLLKQSYYQTVINQTLSLAVGTLNVRQQISKSLNYLLSVPCLCPPSQGAIYLSNKSHVFNIDTPIEENKPLILRKVCSQPESDINDELIIQREDIPTFQTGLFIEKTSDALAHLSYPILFEHDIVGVLFIYVDNTFCHTPEIRSFLSLFTQTLSNIYRLSYSNHAFKRSNEKLKQHKLELEDLIKQRTKELNKALEKQAENNTMLLAANKELAYFATTDSLTGLFNRRHFFELAEQLFKTLMTQNKACSVAMIDVDYFKKVNDLYGHQTGDELLKKVAHTIQNSFDENTIIGRFGGEEFALLLPDISEARSHSLCEALLNKIANTTLYTDAVNPPTTISVTVSIGLTRARPNDKTIEQTLSRADKALYQAKHNGRNTLSVLTGEPQ